jgi:glucokinase
MLTRRAIATPGPAGPLESSPSSSTRSAKLSPSTPTVVAVGVGAIGTIESRTGLIRSAPTLPGFNNIPLGPRLHDALQLPVQVHNDANAATIAEQLRASLCQQADSPITTSVAVTGGSDMKSILAAADRGPAPVAAPASHQGTNRETMVERRQQMPQARSSLAA